MCFLSFVLFAAPIELEKRELFDKKVEILIPKEFKIMSAEMLDFKYPNRVNRPKLVFTNEDGTVNVALNMLANSATQANVTAYKDAIKNSYRKAFPTAAWQGDGVVNINNRKVGYLKLITQAVDQKVYNYLFLTDVDGKIMVGTFNCTEKLMPEWEPIAQKIVSSLIVKAK